MNLLNLTSAVALLAAVPQLSEAAQPPSPADTQERRATDVAPVIVTGHRQHTGLEALTTATISVLSGQDLQRARAPSLGETLTRIPGVQNNSFGPSAGRPEIRGQSGPRVALSVNGVISRDASSLSGDHASPIEPFLADSTVVLKGPATITYGGSAIGGAVEVIDNRIPLSVPRDPFSGRAEISGGYNTDFTVMGRVDGGKGNWAWHADALYRDRSDLRIPGSSKADDCREWDSLVYSVAAQTLCQVSISSPVWERDPVTQLWVDNTPPDKQIITDLNPGQKDRLPHSSQTTSVVTLGGSHITDQGYIGASVQRFSSDYGVPGFAYITPAHRTPSPIDLEVDLMRYDVRAGFYPQTIGLERVDVRVMKSKSDDKEIIDGELHTGLVTDANDIQIDLVHRPWNGLSGAIGLLASHRELETQGVEAYLPSVAITEEGVFWAEQFAWRGLTLKGGIRHDRIDYNVDEDTIRDGRGMGSLAKDRSFNTTNASVSLRYDLPYGLFVQGRYDDAERAPSLIELYSNGNHFGILTEEQGNSGLSVEEAETVELAIGIDSRRYSASVRAYKTEFDNYIYLGNTGMSRTLPVREWRQAATDIEGLEVEAKARFENTRLGTFEVGAFADWVESTPRFTLPDGYSPFTSPIITSQWDQEYFRLGLDGEYLPRMPVSRFGADIAWSRGSARASLVAIHYEAQDKTAKSETPSDAYTLLSAHTAYAFQTKAGQWEAFIDAANLLNEEARPHNSFLRYRAPLGGASLKAGLRLSF